MQTLINQPENVHFRDSMNTISQRAFCDHFNLVAQCILIIKRFQYILTE